jgi:hypothetical protein
MKDWEVSTDPHSQVTTLRDRPMPRMTRLSEQ